MLRIDRYIIEQFLTGIIPALLTGKFDVLIGGMGIRIQRALKVNFTIPYDYSGMSMVASKKMAAGFDSLWVGDHVSFHIPVLDALTLGAFRCPLVANVTAREVDDPAEAREGLARQVTAPVLWEDSVRRLTVLQLREAGYRVIEAESGDRALSQAADLDLPIQESEDPLGGGHRRLEDVVLL